MNKPAPKEPSMDEILSSIRQIIADDDAATAPRKPAAPMPPPIRAAAPAPIAAPRAVEPEPLALTPEQMLRPGFEPEPEPEEATTVLNFSDILGAEDQAPDIGDSAVDAAPLVDPEDITFETDDPPEPQAAAFSVPVEAPSPPPAPIQMAPPPVPRMPPPARPAPTVSRAAPMPDATLTRDMAEELLAPATNAAVKHTFAKLNGLSMQGAGLTLDDLMRDMLRPMLKEWLDENLPSLVERMVEKEIARISRGGE